MIICSTSNIDLIHGQDIEGYGITDGKTDWRITNIPSITPGQTGIFSIFNSVTPTIPNISILETGTVGIGTIPSISSTSKMEILGSVNINGSYMNVSNNATSSTVLSISNNYKVVNSTPFTAEFTGIGNIAPTTHDQVTNAPTDKYMIFTNTSSIGHTFTVPVGGLNCDIFMIGGGGFGDISSGGGAGACIVAINQTLPTGPCVVFVGVGGGPGYNGNDSYIQVAGITRYRAKGGGRGGTTNTSGFIGGCGGGAGENTTGTTTGGSPSVDNIVDGSPANIQPTITSTYAVLGNAGGNNTVINSRAGGGGIGYTPAAGGVGGNGLYQVTLAGETTPINFRNYFANGSATFGVQDGTTGNYYIGGGGSGGFSFLGGLGGGSGNNNGNQAVSNTGSGGSGYFNGSSGIIIIRYRIVTPTLGTPSIELVRGIAGDANTDYKLGNYNGDFKLMSSISNTDTERIVINSIGNVGIRTNVPDNILQVGNSSRLRISNGSSDYTRIGTNDVLGTTNTRINIFGNTSVSCPGQIDYFATSTGNHVFYTTDSNTEMMRITNTGNVGIGTTNPLKKLHLFDNSTNNTSLVIQNNSITVTGTSSPVINPTNVSGGTFSIGQITESIDRFMIFTAGTSSFTVPTGGLNCDILMIGSGGSSGNGGSGAGACIVAINQTFPEGLCTVVVGASVGGSTQVNGQDSSISVAGTIRYLAKGGGFVSGTANTQGGSGGCGGGASPWNTGTAASGGQALSANIVNATPNIGPIITSTYAVLGNAGGGNGGISGAAGGGGGIEPNVSSGAGSSASSTAAGKGGDGAYQVTLNTSPPKTLNFRSYFANNGTFGVENGTTGNYYIGGGGGGLGSGGSQGNGGLGGGGGVNRAGVANTGSGGSTGGASGSGIVIIRYRVNETALGNPSMELIRGTSGDTNTDYKIGNYGGDFKVMSSLSGNDSERIMINSTGNVGIGTTNPTSKLQVNGTINGTLSGDGVGITGLTTSQISGLDTALSGKQATINSTAGQIIIGNGNGSTTTNTNLTFTGSTLTATNISGNGASISSLNAGNVSAGTLAVARGGTGVTAFNANQILVGSLTQSGDLTWDGNSLYVNGNSGSKFVLRGSSPTLYLRDTDNRTGMIHMNGNLMFFLNGSGTDSETWATQNGQSWALTLDMNNNNAVFGGNVSANYYSGNGGGLTNISSTSHNHDSSYASASHTHSGYASSTHNHDTAYASASHTHSGYASSTHNHDTAYASASHTHSGYASSTHNHNESYMTKLTGDPRGFNLNEGWNLPTYLGFGATYWHNQNYAAIQTIHAPGDQPAFSLYISSGNAWVRMYYNGGLAMNTGWTQGSDLRIKCDINKIEDNECLSIIRNISMYKYKLKETRQQKRYKSSMNYGFIAQDVLNFLPQSVFSTKNTIPSIHKPCTIIDDILELDDIDDYIDKHGNIFKYEYEAKIDDILELVLYGDFPSDNKENVKLRITEVITNKKFRIVKVDKDLDYTKKWFVFGNIVDDFLSLEHNMIHNVGIGAIKCIDNDVIILKNDIKILQDENKLLKNKLNLLSNHIGMGDII